MGVLLPLPDATLRPTMLARASCFIPLPRWGRFHDAGPTTGPQNGVNMAEVYPLKAQEHLRDAVRHLGSAMLSLHKIDPDETNPEILAIENGIIRQSIEIMMILQRKHEKTDP
jgi:hypothetical protein